MQTISKRLSYFPNLNGLRFIAAALVIIHHIELNKKSYNILTLEYLSDFFYLGKLGVVLFFVLSGFLITYLLLLEEEKNNSISIKNFYIKRVLRIWPLYFLILILGVLILPNFNFFQVEGVDYILLWQNITIILLLGVFFLPTLALLIFPDVTSRIGHLWSIGTEELFYLI